MATDGFEYGPDHTLAAEHGMIDALLRETRKEYGFKPLRDTPAGARIAALDPQGTRRVVLALLERIARLRATSLGGEGTLAQAVGELLRRRLPFTADDLSVLCDVFLGPASRGLWFEPRSAVLRTLEAAAKSAAGLGEGVVAVLDAFERGLGAALEGGARGTPDQVKLLDRCRALLGRAPELPIRPGEVWADRALADVRALPSGESAAWATLLATCQKATTATPNGKWLKEATAAVEALGAGALAAQLVSWFPLVDRPRELTAAEAAQPFYYDRRHAISDQHMDLLRGLVWAATLCPPDAELTSRLGGLAISAYRKIAGLGPRATRVGNACVWALGAIGDDAAVGQLARLRIKVKFGTAQKGIDKALEETAARLGLPREDLEEMAVPAYGLDEVGLRRESLGAFTAEVEVLGTSKVELRWRKADGTLQKSVPAAVKADHTDELKELRQAVKDIQQMLPAQRDRIDGLFLAQRTWPLPGFRERYLDHPLVGTLARRLIWRFAWDGGVRDACWLGDGLVDAHDAPLSLPGDGVTVSMWHPVEADGNAVLAWRAFFERHRIAQPFKQAHRELYVLTDAERATGTYSNRFAAHVVKQHQFHALCGHRGWSNRLRLLVDAEYEPATRLLPAWGLRAEFWIEGLGDDYRTDTNEAGSFLYLGTDQVRFYTEDAPRNAAHASGGGYAADDAGGNVGLALDRVPALVFSEVMRDVDLFVGVASVGNDPTWSDTGPEARHMDYWRGYSFGELSTTAKARREMFERLLPKLAIGPRCTLAERFLVVRGELRTYKIHLGSGNILMEPNDEYLCIVPAQGKARQAEQIFLPFEGDARTSVILSKAILLAADTKITDPTILSQIHPR